MTEGRDNGPLLLPPGESVEFIPISPNATGPNRADSASSGCGASPSIPPSQHDLGDEQIRHEKREDLDLVK